MSIKEYIRFSIAYLRQSGIPDATRCVEQIYTHVLNVSKDDLLLDPNLVLNKKDREELQKMLSRRAKKEPIEYIIGSVPFYDCIIDITKDVLIPRVETEILVDKIVNRLKKRDLSEKVLFDICCGSGCIGIALKKALPDLRVFLSDISKKACELAKKNARKNGVDLIVYQGDLLAPFQDKMADYLVSNPPYVSIDEYQNLDLSVKDHEPKVALVGQEDGLEFYKRFSLELKHFLKPKGQVFFEIGYMQGDSIKNLFKQSLKIEGKVLKDLSLKDRFFFLEIE